MTVSQTACDAGRVSVRLAEWSTLEPTESGAGALLRGLSFDSDLRARREAERLTKQGVLRLTERRDGLAIQTGSYIGRISVGPIDVTIIPKIDWGQWLTLIRFALRLRTVLRSDYLRAPTSPDSLEELLIVELLAEARDLISRGVHREYMRFERPLASPRGRIAFGRVARAGGVLEARIPSRFTRRSENSPLNRALLSGLVLAGDRAATLALRSEARQLTAELGRSVDRQPASVTLLSAAERTVDRRTRRYEPALRLTRLLLDGQALSVGDATKTSAVSIRGFAIDMNEIWQRVLWRVLSEWASGVEVRSEYALRRLFQSNSRFPIRGRVPRPRPDYAVFVNGRLLGFLDAKYRDLWKTKLPREMLYQLAVYAMAQGRGTAAILYPTDAHAAAEQRIDIRDPLLGDVRCSVGLRPVALDVLAELIASPTSGMVETRRAEFARLLIGHD
jgi:5-methylcytosine-specific restriction enzyme subunit McrC